MPVKNNDHDKFKTATSRLDRSLFPHNKRPHWCHLDHGISLGYRTSEPHGPRGQRGPGKWVKKLHGKETPLGTADDYEVANGVEVKTFAQAVFACLGDVRTETAVKRVTLGQAFDRWQQDTEDNQVPSRYVKTARNKVLQAAPQLLDCDLELLSKEDLLSMRRALVKAGITAPTWERNARMIAAVLNKAAPHRNAVWK